MPWDATRLRVAAFEPDGTLGESALAAGGPDESIAQPEWSPDGTLHLVSDRTGWWNLYRLVEGPRLEPLAPMEAEFADPAWIFDRSSYGFLADGAIVAVARSGGRDHLYRIEPGLLVGEIEIAVHGARRAARRRAHGRRHRRPPGRPARHRPVRSRDPGAGRRPPAREHGHDRPRGHRRARVDRVPDDRRPDRPRALLRAAPTRPSPRRTASARRSWSCRTVARPRTPRPRWTSPSSS